MLSNFDVHDEGMRYIRKLLEEENWIVEEIKNGKDDYLQINKSESYKTYKIKVKALSKKDPVPFHTRSPESINADFFVICRNMETGNPEIFTATMTEVIKATHKHNNDYWLEIPDYERFERGIAKLKSLKTF